MKLGVFVPNWIGDAAMCTPALRALRTHFGPTAHITGIMRPYVADVLAGTPWLDDELWYHPKSTDRKQRTRTVLAEMRVRNFDIVLLLTNSLRAAALAWASGAKTRVGYVRYGRGPLLTHKLYPPRQGRHWLPIPAIDTYLQLVQALGCETDSTRLELATLPVDEAAADAVWHKFKLPSGQHVVVLNSGGAYGAAKLWPAAYFAELAQRIAVRHNLAVLVNCGPAEREVAREIVARAGHARVVSLADESASLGLSKACIRRSRLLVTTDSGPRFIGVAFGLPVVTLFGPTNPAWTRSHWPAEVCLSHAVPCGPCGRRVCPLEHHDCMRLLDVDTVYRAVCAQLEIHRSARAA
jgi:heptosyltransferase II